MYATCLFCHGPLGQNERVEHFPVGRRLAYDAERGRLWVVCRKCARWNLTPLEERWEAIEECERLFQTTPRRASTDNIALAKLADGLELVRIGRPGRPEFAAWRFGEQIGRRRREAMVKAGLGIGAIAAVIVGGAVAGVAVASFGGMYGTLFDRVVHGSKRKLIARVPVPGGPDVEVRRKHLKYVQLVRHPEAGWALGIPHHRIIIPVTGTNALSAAGQLLTQMNRYAGKREDIERAVSMLESEPDPMRAYVRIVDARRGNGLPSLGRSGDTAHSLALLPDPMRLALEMAAHEEQERRALEGELATLEQAWRDAEEIAKIADEMFLPSWVQERIDRWRQ